MARPEKEGLEYFSHDTDMFEDPRIKFLKVKHGLLGYAVYNRLLEMIYREQGYFIIFNDRELCLFADENKIEIDRCSIIIQDCIQEGLFDAGLYDRYKILTSRRIQKNYIKGCERRKLIILIGEFLLIDPEEQKNSQSKVKIIIASINGVNVNINSIKAYISTQKEKEKEKEKESKVERESTHAPAHEAPNPEPSEQVLPDYDPEDSPSECATIQSLALSASEESESSCSSRKFERPSLHQVKEHFELSGFPISEGENFWSYYDGRDWEDNRGSPIAFWRSLVIGWMNKSKHFINSGNGNESANTSNNRPKSSFEQRLGYQYDPDGYQQDLQEFTERYG